MEVEEVQEGWLIESLNKRNSEPLVFRRKHELILRNGPSDQSEKKTASQSRPPAGFGGSGNRLGSEDDPASEDDNAAGPSGAGPSVAGVTPSQFDRLLAGMLGQGQQPPPPEEEEVQQRTLTFWRNGFSIEDGPLMSYDEPGNKEILEAIHIGRAPPSLFGVRYNQPLQVVVSHRKGEDYVAPPKVLKPFEGGGNRLGSSVPEVGSGSSTPAMPGGFGDAPAAAPTAPSGATSDFTVDESKPTTSIQLRLGDGTRSAILGIVTRPS